MPGKRSRNQPPTPAPRKRPKNTCAHHCTKPCKHRCQGCNPNGAYTNSTNPPLTPHTPTPTHDHKTDPHHDLTDDPSDPTVEGQRAIDDAIIRAEEDERIRSSTRAAAEADELTRTRARNAEHAKDKERDAQRAAHRENERAFEAEQAERWSQERAKSTNNTQHRTPTDAPPSGAVPPGETPFSQPTFDDVEQQTPNSKQGPPTRPNRTPPKNRIGDIFFTKKRANNVTPLNLRDTRDIVKVTTFLMDIDKLHNNHDYDLAVQAMIAYCPDSTICSAAATSLGDTDATKTAWHTICRLALDTWFRTPDTPISAISAAIHNHPQRNSGESLDTYYRPFQGLLEQAEWLRTLYNRLSEPEWLILARSQWCSKINSQWAHLHCIQRFKSKENPSTDALYHELMAMTNVKNLDADNDNPTQTRQLHALRAHDHQVADTATNAKLAALNATIDKISHSHAELHAAITLRNSHDRTDTKDRGHDRERERERERRHRNDRHSHDQPRTNPTHDTRPPATKRFAADGQCFDFQRGTCTPLWDVDTVLFH
jgi:hypothetical protein